MGSAGLTNELTVPKLTESPLVFISHDNRDGELAEAFAKLVKGVSAGMLKSFRSSDKTGMEGIEFGDEWYKTIMAKLEMASDVVCLLTERSLDRPWLLYEAGVAKGKLSTPVHGLALGVPLARASTGPFYQFQNSDDSEESLTKLVLQLCRRVQGMEPEQEVVKAQVQAFKLKVDPLIGKMGTPQKAQKKEAAEETAVAKVLEEMKLIIRDLPGRIEQSLTEQRKSMQHLTRYRGMRLRKMHFGLIDELSFRVSGRYGNPVGILLIASTLQERFPWLYEAGMEAYRSLRSRPSRSAEALRAFRDLSELTARGPLRELIGPLGEETEGWLRELPKFLDYYIDRIGEHPQDNTLTEPPVGNVKPDKGT